MQTLKDNFGYCSEEERQRHKQIVDRIRLKYSQVTVKDAQGVGISARSRTCP